MFSKTCEYAIRAVLFIAQKSADGTKIGIREIAKGIDSPEHFIAKILQDLSRKGMVQSQKGPAGGFYLQFGAFSEQGNADAERARLQQNWDSALPPLEVYSVGLFYRLHSGPFTSREDAQAAAQKLLSIANVRAMVVEH